MHELSIVIDLVDQIECDVEAAGQTGTVVRIELAVGRLSGVHADALRFAFDVVKEGSIAENAELAIQQPSAYCTCRACDARVTMDELVATCPICGSREIVIEGGRELLLNSIDVES